MPKHLLLITRCFVLSRYHFETFRLIARIFPRVRDKVIFNFDLDLQLLEDHRNWPVRETYVGDLMAIRHRILVAAHRPWYTFNVYKEVRTGVAHRTEPTTNHTIPYHIVPTTSSLTLGHSRSEENPKRTLPCCLTVN